MFWPIRYISDADLVRLGGEDTTLMPKEDDGLRFPLHNIVVGVLKRLNIYLYQLTPNTIIRIWVIIWVVRR
jgi:hypothetical protein